MPLIQCDRSYRSEIQTILNDAIAHSTAIWDYYPRDSRAMDEWFASKEVGGYPVLGLVSDANEFLGFATYGKFRFWPAYKYTVEHSVYVHRLHRAQGYGEELLSAAIDSAKSNDYHNMIAAIEATNVASKKLHSKLGFEPCGLIRQAGFKFGRWLDLEFYQLLLDTPRQPRDG